MAGKGTIPLAGDPERRTVEDLCKAVGVSESTIFRYIKQGMPSYLVAGQRIFRWPEVLDWLNERSQTQTGGSNE